MIQAASESSLRHRPPPSSPHPLRLSYVIPALIINIMLTILLSQTSRQNVRAWYLSTPWAGTDANQKNGSQLAVGFTCTIRSFCVLAAPTLDLKSTFVSVSSTCCCHYYHYPVCADTRPGGASRVAATLTSSVRCFCYCCRSCRSC